MTFRTSCFHRKARAESRLEQSVWYCLTLGGDCKGKTTPVLFCFLMSSFCIVWKYRTLLRYSFTDCCEISPQNLSHMSLVSTELSPVSLHLHFILLCIKPVYFPHYLFIRLFASVLCLLHLMCLFPSPHAFTVVVWSFLSFCVTLCFPLPAFCYEFVISPPGLGGDSESL